MDVLAQKPRGLRRLAVRSLQQPVSHCALATWPGLATAGAGWRACEESCGSDSASKLLVPKLVDALPSSGAEWTPEQAGEWAWECF